MYVGYSCTLQHQKNYIKAAFEMHIMINNQKCM